MGNDLGGMQIEKDSPWQKGILTNPYIQMDRMGVKTQDSLESNKSKWKMGKR